MGRTKNAASLWLLAAGQDETDLAAEINRLASLHGTPPFHPHMTLLGDISQAPESLLDANRKIAAAAQPFDAAIAAIVTGDEYYRSFYARFDASEPLLALRRAALALFPALQAPFLPHVSLLYGAPTQGSKQSSAQNVARRLIGRSIRFDRLALTNSGNDVAIRDWRCIDSVPLG